MKILIEGQEWYPVYAISTCGAEAEVSQEFIDRYNRIMKEHDKITDELEKLYDEYYRKKKILEEKKRRIR